jgi:hypothetical protein
MSMNSRKVFGPHRGSLWTATLGQRTITFRPIQLLGGRRWSLALIRISGDTTGEQQ